MRQPDNCGGESQCPCLSPCVSQPVSILFLSLSVCVSASLCLSLSVSQRLCLSVSVCVSASLCLSLSLLQVEPAKDLALDNLLWRWGRSIGLLINCCPTQPASGATDSTEHVKAFLEQYRDQLHLTLLCCPRASGRQAVATLLLQVARAGFPQVAANASENPDKLRGSEIERQRQRG